MKRPTPLQRIKEISGELASHPDIVAFQLNWNEGQGLRSGFQDSKLGDIYHPIKINQKQAGNFALEFKDGSLARGPLLMSSTAATTIEIARNIAYTDKEGLVIAEASTSYEAPKLMDPKLKQLILENPAELSDITYQLQMRLLSHHTEHTEGKIIMGYRSGAFINSNGAEYESEETSEVIEVEFDHEVGLEKASRQLVNLDDFDTLAQRQAEYSNAMRKKSAKLEDSKLPILMSGDYGFSILDHYLVSNFAGLLIDAGTSKFSRDDFTQHKAVMQPKLSLAYDQIADYQPSSFTFTPDGVLPQQFMIIKDGKLVDPICDPKTARKFKLPARSVNSTADAKLTGAEDYKSYLTHTPRFILVFAALGVHTQNPILGDYSLPCPLALLIENGEVKGKVNCVLSGNFFDTMLSDDFGFVTMPDAFEKPLLSFSSHATIK